MIFKIIAFVVAAIPIFLFVRSIFFRRPTQINEGFKEFKKGSTYSLWPPAALAQDEEPSVRGRAAGGNGARRRANGGRVARALGSVLPASSGG
jgi:hypothetical protein